MDKIYVFYLMCAGISLIFLSTYFTWAYPEYTNSIFYVVDVILLSSILMMILLRGEVKAFASKLIILSFFLLLIYFGVVIVENLFQLTTFGVEVLTVFSNFFFISALIMIMVSSLIIAEKQFLLNRKGLLIIFSPLIIFSLWIVLNRSFLLSGGLFEQVFFQNALLIFTLFYSFLTFYNLMSVVLEALAVRQKFVLIVLGLTVIFLSTGFRQSDFLFELSPIFSVVGSFLLCFGLMVEPTLELHNRILSELFDNLEGEETKDFIKYLEGVFYRRERLKADISEEGVDLIDNPELSNVDEKRLYHKVVLLAYKWYRKNIKNSDSFLDDLKSFYNEQSMLAKRLRMFFI